MLAPMNEKLEKKKLTKSNTRVTIINAAFPLFAERGFSGVTTRTICSRARVGIATLYHHFPSKEVLYVESIRHAYAQRAERYHQLQKENMSPTQRLRRMIQLYVEIAAHDLNILKLVKREQLERNSKRMRLIFDSSLGDQAQVMHEIVAAVCSDSDDPQMVTVSIMGMILHRYEAALFWPTLKYHQPQHLEPATVADHVFNLIARSLNLRE